MSAQVIVEQDGVAVLAVPVAKTVLQVTTPAASVSVLVEQIAGPQGPAGADGAAGAAGVGVPAGGSTGQVLTKNSATNYDTVWATPSGGGGGGVTYDEVHRLTRMFE